MQERENMMKLKKSEIKQSVQAFKDEKKVMDSIREVNQEPSGKYGKFDEVLTM